MNKTSIFLLLLTIISCGMKESPDLQKLSGDPVVTGEAKEVSSNSAVLSGYVSTEYLLSKDEVGFMISKSPSPSMDNGQKVVSKEIDKDGYFSVQLSKLDPATTYYYKAYLNLGKSYLVGDIRQFTTFFVAVSSVQLNNNTLSLIEGDTEWLIATVEPADATDQTVTWESSVPEVATVEKGKVTAIKEGTATIIASCGGKNAYCSVTVSKAVVAVTSVSLNKTTLMLDTGASETLVATVKPDDATDKSITWSSANPTVATVDQNGKVTAVTAGSASIRVTTEDGGKTASCSVTVKSTQSSGSSNGHAWVNLGLPSGLKWATCNVGATKPEEYGDYFAWGETEPYYEAGYAQSGSPVWKSGKENGYYWPSYKWYNIGDWYKITKYCTQSINWGGTGPMDNKTKLDPEDDAAHVNWSSSWRMPTLDEWNELFNNCTWTWTTQNGVKGYKVFSKTNGNSIFLPAAGYRYDTYLYDAGSCGYFWSSSLNSDYPYGASYVNFGSYNYNWDYNYRCHGFSVRPVSE